MQSQGEAGKSERTIFGKRSLGSPSRSWEDKVGNILGECRLDSTN
jgi:hypothetical protein